MVLRSNGIASLPQRIVNWRPTFMETVWKTRRIVLPVNEANRVFCIRQLYDKSFAKQKEIRYDLNTIADIKVSKTTAASSFVCFVNIVHNFSYLHLRLRFRVRFLSFLIDTGGQGAHLGPHRVLKLTWTEPANKKQN